MEDQLRLAVKRHLRRHTAMCSNKKTQHVARKSPFELVLVVASMFVVMMVLEDGFACLEDMWLLKRKVHIYKIKSQLATTLHNGPRSGHRTGPDSFRLNWLSR